MDNDIPVLDNDIPVLDAEEQLAEFKEETYVLNQFDERLVISNVAQSSIDCEFFIFDFIKTLDVETGETRPFGMFNAPGDLSNNAYQPHIRKLIKDLFDYITKGIPVTIVIDKSRQMYITQTICAFFVWCWLFLKNFSAGITSQTEEKLDKEGDDKTIFGIIRFMINNLPSYMKPDPSMMIDAHMRLVYTDRNNMIIGSASDDPFRGSQLTIGFNDEHAMQDRSFQKYRSMREAVKKIMLNVSTPRGKKNKFAELRWSKTGGIKVYSFHHSLRRTPEWYKKKCEEDYVGDDEGRAQELDMSYEGSVKGRVFKYFVPTEHVVIFNDPNAFAQQLQRSILTTGTDFGFAHAHVFIWIAKMNNGQYVIFDEYVANQGTIEQHVSEFNRINSTWGLNARQRMDYADPAGKQRRQESDGITLWQMFETKGIRFTDAENDVKVGIITLNSLFARNKLLISSKCVNVIDAFSEAIYPTNRNGEVIGDKYKEAEWSDVLDGCRYGLTTEIRNKLYNKEDNPVTYRENKNMSNLTLIQRNMLTNVRDMMAYRKQW